MGMPRAIHTVLCAAVIALTLIIGPCLNASAGYLPETPEAFVKKVRNFATNNMRPLMAGLYNWFGVDDTIRPSIELGLDSILAKKIVSVELAPVPKGFPIQFNRAGVIYERNVPMDHTVKFTLLDDRGNELVKYLPFGKTPEGYAFAASVPAKDLARAWVPPEPKQALMRPPLEIKIAAPAGVVTEIVCAYIDKKSGERKVHTWRADGGLLESVDGSKFETCAAKKRSGTGSVEVVLEQAGTAIYAQSTDQVDLPMIYRSE